MSESTIEKLPPIKAFNPHSNCKGHACAFLDCTYEYREERDLMVKILDKYIEGDIPSTPLRVAKVAVPSKDELKARGKKSQVLRGDDSVDVED